MSKVKAFQNHLRKIMKDKGVSQYKLAEMMGVDEKTISQLLNRDSYPKMETIDEICRVLEIGKGDLFSYESSVDYQIELLPGDVDLIEIRHELSDQNKARLNGYADRLKEEKQ